MSKTLPTNQNILVKAFLKETNKEIKIQSILVENGEIVGIEDLKGNTYKIRDIELKLN